MGRQNKKLIFHPREHVGQPAYGLSQSVHMFYLLVHKNISETSRQRAVREEKSYLEKLALIASTFLTASLSVNSLCHLFNHQFRLFRV
jgi:hypothetical protein